MIKSDIIKLPFTNDNAEIENMLRSKNIEPLRWAVVKVSEQELEISVSYRTNDY